jgi:glycosyltransferase involved in cell wall biosynthesis
MRVAIFGTNDPQNVGGGRYHALMLAYAVASLGWEAHVVTDHKPSFFHDLEPLAPDGGVKLHLTPDFAGRLPAGPFDWVVVVPTGIFLPEFYENGLAFARASGARIALVNFETATWFNALAPQPRDPRLWDYWRRVCVEGALVLSSARESNGWAQGFYRAPDGRLRFEVWQPPINSAAARRFDELPKDGSLVAFIRPQDVHKGSGFLAELDPRLLSGRTLHLISGREAPPAFLAAIARRLDAADARLAFHLRVTDEHKFRLVAAAQAVLFPSRFEGYGYPPVEAAYSGTECAAFDLPVLRETVGGVAHFAPTPDRAGFESALRAALAAPERRAELRRAVFEIADFDRCALRLADILLRSADAVAPLAPRAFRALVGPLARTPPQPPESVARDAPTPPFPAYVFGLVETSGGDLLASVRAFLPAATSRVEATLASSGAPLAVACRFAGRPADGLAEARLYILAPKDAAGQRILATARGEGLADVAPIELRLERAEPADPRRPGLAGVSEDKVGPGGRRLRGWALAREALAEILLAPDGRAFLPLAVDRERRDIAAKFPAYATARCEYQGEIPAAPELDRDRALVLCVAAGRGVDALTGWPPAPKSYFAGGGWAAAAPAEPAAAPAAPARASGPKPRRPQLGEIALAGFNDAAWRNGVALAGAPGRLGAVAVAKDVDPALVKPGGVLRFASGAARRIVSAEPQGAHLVVALDGPLAPEAAGRPARAAAYDGDWTTERPRQFVLFPWTDQRWWRGVWNTRDARFRCGLTIKSKEARALGFKVGAALRFAASGVRHIREIDENGGNMRVWLDGPVRPLADMEPHPITALAAAEADDGLVFAPAGESGRVLAVAGEAGRRIRAGDLLRLAGGGLARVLATRPGLEGAQLTLDRPLEEAEARGRLSLVDEVDAPDGYLTPYRRPGFGLKAKDPLFRTLARDALKRGSALRPVRPAPSGQRRALVVSSVSPCPANQGNRVVTRNLIRRLVALGLQCDVVVQNAVDAAAAADEFGPNARFFPVAYPNWQAAEAHGQRKAIAAAAERLRAQPLDAPLAETIEAAASQYHPYFIVRDETVDMARALYAQHAYDAVVVNYTHMIRVAEELQALRPLPPTAVLTHDALSRLPRAFAGRKLDLGHRACSPETERETLDAIPGACIVAISNSEAQYFRGLGVKNRIVTTEFDAAEEMAPYAVPPDAFARRTLIFHGSANPMNVAGLDWFVDECWAEILAAAPQTRLVVCGNVGAAWKPQLPGIEIVGEQPRERMLQLCAAASVAINPCVAGTGLKIKTVETAALGLPAVCLPTAVDGLEDIADRFAIVAEDAAGFVAGCVALLTDPERWSGLRDSARAVAAQRFAADAVYRELDEAMGWLALNAAPRAAPAPDEEPAGAPLTEFANPLAALEQEPDNEAAQFALGKSLARGRHAEAGWPIVDQIASAWRGDWRAAGEAAELGLETGAPWRAAVHAARVIAQRPADLRGYLLMGRALMACNLPHEAAAAFEQGLMAAPFDGPAQKELAEALARAKRPEEAEAWRARPSFALNLGQYVSLRARLPGLSVRGFESEADDALALWAGEGALLLPAPHGAARRLSLALEVARPRELAGDVELELSLETLRAPCRLQARGAGIQAFTLEAEADAFACGFARLGLRIVSETPLAAPLRLVGLLIEARESGGRLLASA